MSAGWVPRRHVLAGERRLRVRAVPDVAGTGPVNARGVTIDGLAWSEARRAGRTAETRLDIGFEQTAIGTAVADLDGVHTRVNPALCRFLGRPAGLLLGRKWTEYTHAAEVPLDQAMQTRLAAGQDTYEDERRYLRPDGSTVWASAHVTLVRDEMSRPEYFYLQLDDITRRKQMEHDLAHQALHDALTGLPNRALLHERLVQGLARSRRHGMNLGVIFLDLDRFKLINDSLGHASGDSLLRISAQRIATAIRPGDTVARLGGDEFVIVCDDVSGVETEQIAERVLEAVCEPCVLGDHEATVTASVGIAVASEHATAESLLRDSDAAMYRAKERGRARIELFDSLLRAKVESRLATTAALNLALERHEFTLQYQPIVDLVTGTIVSTEALLRWDRPAHGLLGPDEFIALAEESGLIVPIGAWVLEQACRQLADWQRIGPALSDRSDPAMAVNLAVRQVLAPDIVDVVAAALDRNGVPPERLCLELPESLFLEDVDCFGGKLNDLKDLGVRLAIHDFGTGHSSLSCLRRFPVDIVKVDRSFVDGLGTEPNDSAIVGAIIAMASALELETTAEGIETEEQLAALRRFDCMHGQGYLLARPAPADVLSHVLAGSADTPVDLRG